VASFVLWQLYQGRKTPPSPGNHWSWQSKALARFVSQYVEDAWFEKGVLGPTASNNICKQQEDRE
jgi:hypothetical protein